MKAYRLLSLTVLLGAVLLSAPNAAGQAIPVDIPDTPGESPADRERQKREERHRATFSRFFGTTSVSASSVVTGPGVFFDTVIEGGVELRNGDALFFQVGARSVSEFAEAPRVGPPTDLSDARGNLFALGYELGLAQFSSRPVIGGSTVSFSLGGFMGDVGMLYVDVSPRYVIRANQYWSLPVGLKFTTAFLDEHAKPVGTVGITAGVRRHFGQRRSLE